MTTTYTNSSESRRSGFRVSDLEFRHFRRAFTAFRAVLGFTLLGVGVEDEGAGVIAAMEAEKQTKGCVCRTAEGRV